MPELRSEDTIDATAAAHSHPFEWRRRQLVVDARYQLRAGILVGVVALVLLVLLNAALLVPGRAASHPAAPTARALPVSPDGVSWVLVLVGSAVLLCGVIVIGVLESHRTAGAAYAIRRAVDALREGRPDARVHLRRNDHLQELARAVNQLAEAIDAERARHG